MEFVKLNLTVVYETKVQLDLNVSTLAYSDRFSLVEGLAESTWTASFHQSNTMWDLASWVRWHSKHHLLLLVWNKPQNWYLSFWLGKGSLCSLLHSNTRSHCLVMEVGCPLSSIPQLPLEWWPQKWSYQAREFGLRWGPPSSWFYFSPFTDSLTNTSRKYLKH